MKTLAKTLLLAFLAMIALPLACEGGGDEEGAVRRQVSSADETADETSDETASGTADRREPDPSKSAEADASPEAIAMRDELPRDLWIWPDDPQSRPAFDADLLECTSRLVEDPALVDRPGLAQVDWILDCMSERGWARNPDFEPPRGG